MQFSVNSCRAAFKRLQCWGPTVSIMRSKSGWWSFLVVWIVNVSWKTLFPIPSFLLPPNWVYALWWLEGSLLESTSSSIYPAPLTFSPSLPSPTPSCIIRKYCHHYHSTAKQISYSGMSTILKRACLHEENLNSSQSKMFLNYQTQLNRRSYYQTYITNKRPSIAWRNVYHPLTLMPEI